MNVKIAEMLQEVVATISDAVVVASGPDGKPVRVRDVLTDPAAFIHYGDAMAALGVWLTEKRPGRPVVDLDAKDYIFVDVRKLKKTVLKGTEVATWPNLDRTMMMIQGSQRAQRSLGKWRASGIEIPLVGWRWCMEMAVAAA